MSAQRRMRLVATAVAASCALAAATAGCAPAARRHEPSANSTELAATAETSATSIAEMQRRMFDEWARGQRRFTSRAKAQAELPFTLKMPDPSLVPTPAVFYVQPGRSKPKTRARVTVIFGEQGRDSINFIANRSKVKQDPQAQVEQAEQDRRSGFLKSDHTWQLVDINGIEAEGVEPGINAGARADHRLRPGVVHWWDGGAHYVLMGTQGPFGTPLADLVAIAESMK